jgi:hypothetical protein
MQVFNALQIKGGAKIERNKMGTLTQPVQFLPKSEKTDDWAAWNLDWLEWQGMKQIRRNARRLLKNYKLAKGIIDRSDYIVEDDPEYADLIDVLTKEDSSALELKFYPIIPNVINVLVSEFAKRNTTVTFRTTDDISYNELLEEKRAMVEAKLISDAQQKLVMKMIEMGADMEDPEIQQALAPESLKSLPEIEGFFKKDYRSMLEEWAEHQMRVDYERFKMDELEERAFRDMLITDREFWHFKMNDDDYEVELWNPLITFYHKSPDVRYVSQGNWVGKIDMMTVADIIDKYGYLMTEEQMRSMEAIYPTRAAGYPIGGQQNDGSYYDGTKSHEWNTGQPGLAYRQFTSLNDGPLEGGDIVNWILSESEDYFDYKNTDMLRVANIYWKSQRKVGHLTRVDENGDVIQDVVDEMYKVTLKPIYDTTVFKNKTKENLIAGEHIDWIWINEVWGGVKIGPNYPAYWGMNNYSPDGVNPIYLGINKQKPGRVPFQFKGDATLYGCKLPVEGSVFSDRNTRSTSLVDLMKPFQIGYNIVNNQIADILVDELGTVIMLDQNALPRHSLGEDWGKNNLAKAYVAMKDFQMLPLDTSITNTENALNFQHYQVLNLEQTQRLLSRIQLSNYFKQQAYEVIGITPQRMGQQVEQTTATGLRIATANSYAQTEVYFMNHCDYLMPRVHQMRTDLAQYYHSTKPSVRLQYVTSADEKVNFEIEGSSFLLRDFNIFATTKANHRAVLEQLKQLAISNNTTGASIYDLGNIIKAESISEVSHILKATEERQMQQRQEEMQQQQQMQQQALQAKQQEEMMKMQFEQDENAKDRQKDLLIAQIRGAGYGSTEDINQNQMSDYQDALKEIRKSDEFQQQMTIKKESNAIKQAQGQDLLNLKREELATKREIANKQLEVARTNKNKYDKPSNNKGGQ